jgi:hypothetical protein
LKSIFGSAEAKNVSPNPAIAQGASPRSSRIACFFDLLDQLIAMGFNALADRRSPEKAASGCPYSAKSLQAVQLTLFGIYLARRGNDFPLSDELNNGRYLQLQHAAHCELKPHGRVVLLFVDQD